MPNNRGRFYIACNTCGYIFRRSYPANPDTLRPYDCPKWQSADRAVRTIPEQLANRRHQTTCIDPFDPRIIPAESGHVRDLSADAIAAAVTYRVKVRIMHAGGRAEYVGNGLTFDSLRAADEYAIELLSRWTLPDGWIVESNERNEWEMIATR